MPRKNQPGCPCCKTKICVALCGDPVPNALITIYAADGTVLWTCTTDATGCCQVRGVAGRYLVTVTISGVIVYSAVRQIAGTVAIAIPGYSCCGHCAIPAEDLTCSYTWQFGTPGPPPNWICSGSGSIALAYSPTGGPQGSPAWQSDCFSLTCESYLGGFEFYFFFACEDNGTAGYQPSLAVTALLTIAGPCNKAFGQYAIQGFPIVSLICGSSFLEVFEQQTFTGPYLGIYFTPTVSA